MLAGQTSQDRTVRLAGSSAASLLGTAAWSSCSCCLMGCAGASEPWSPSLRGGLRSCQMCGSRCFTPWLHRGWGQRGAPGSPVRGVGHSGCSRSMLGGPLCPFCSRAPGLLGQWVSSPSMALCHLQPSASRPRRFLWQGCGVSASPRPVVCVRARCFLPACPAAPR